MRPLALAAASLLALAACEEERAEGGGKRAGEACLAAAECGRGLVCFERACAASYAAAPSCAPPGSPRIVRGDPVQLPEVPEGLCVTAAREPVPASASSPGAPLAPGEFVDLGEQLVGTELTLDVPPGTSGLTIVSQDVLGDAAIREIVFQGFRLPNTVVPTDVRLPGGALFFSDTDPFPIDDGGYDDVTRLLAYYGGFNSLSGSFTVPNTAAALDLVRSRGEIPPGTWTFTVNDWARECLGIPVPIPGCQGGSDAGRYRVHAFAQPGPLASTGTLDLEVYVATDPAGPMGSASVAVPDPPAAPHPQIRRFVAKLGEQLARAGICLGTVTFRDLPDWARQRLAPGGVVDISGAGLDLAASDTPLGCDDLSQLFTVGVAPSRGVHLFLADDLVDGSAGGGTVLGIDGSIPGPSGFPGTVNGGAIVGAFHSLGAESFPGACTASSEAPPWTCGTDVLAYVAAHEAGHWLGLYHTTEAFGTTFDPLSDTPRCPCLACAPAGERSFCAETGAPAPTFMAGEFCSGTTTPAADVAARAVPGLACGGAQNLMFWLFDPDRARGDVSREQGEVMRLNPAVRR